MPRSALRRNNMSSDMTLLQESHMIPSDIHSERLARKAQLARESRKRKKNLVGNLQQENDNLRKQTKQLQDQLKSSNELLARVMQIISPAQQQHVKSMIINRDRVEHWTNVLQECFEYKRKIGDLEAFLKRLKHDHQELTHHSHSMIDPRTPTLLPLPPHGSHRVPPQDSPLQPLPPLNLDQQHQDQDQIQAQVQDLDLNVNVNLHEEEDSLYRCLEPLPFHYDGYDVSHPPPMSV